MSHIPLGVVHPHFAGFVGDEDDEKETSAGRQQQQQFHLTIDAPGPLERLHSSMAFRRKHVAWAPQKRVVVASVEIGNVCKSVDLPCNLSRKGGLASHCGCRLLEGGGLRRQG